jgi:alkylhydroperoxidase family enzyme
MTQAALITPTLTSEEQTRVDAIFADVEQKMGFIPDGLKLYSTSPPLLEAFLGNIGYFMAHPSIRQELLATIRFLVASKSECNFCIDFNEALLSNLGVDTAAVREARNNPDKAPLPDKEKALLKEILKTLDNPGNMTAETLQNLKALGWTEREVFEALLVGSNNRSFSTMLKAFNVETQGAFA